MANELSGRTIAFLTADEGVEQVELTEPWEAVKKAGGTPRLLSPKGKKVQGFNHLDRADKFDADGKIADADPATFDAVVLPGGVANPDQLRRHKPAIEFLRTISGAGKPIAAICHGPWTLVEADLVRDRTLTSWPSLQTDIRNAGGTFVDEEVHVDDGGTSVLITSRKPDDLKAFCRTFVEIFAKRSAQAA